MGQKAGEVGGNGDVSRWIEGSASQARAQLRTHSGTRLGRKGFGDGAQGFQHEVDKCVRFMAAPSKLLQPSARQSSGLQGGMLTARPGFRRPYDPYNSGDPKRTCFSELAAQWWPVRGRQGSLARYG